jgi:hypothetical protein
MPKLAKRISKQDVREMLSEKNPVRDEELIGFDGREAYELSDGTVLLINKNGSGDLWPSRATIMKVVARGTGPIVGFWAEHLPSGRDFINRLDSLIGRLPGLLGIEIQSLDYTVESVRTLDAKIDLRDRAQCLEHPCFESLVAYVGEVLRRRQQGSWEMRPMGDGRTWQPFVVLTDGSEIPVFVDLYKQLSQLQKLSDLYHW